MAFNLTDMQKNEVLTDMYIEVVGLREAMKMDYFYRDRNCEQAITELIQGKNTNPSQEDIFRIFYGLSVNCIENEGKCQAIIALQLISL